MKKLVMVVIFIAILGGSVPFYAGVKAQQELDKVVALIDASPGYEASWKSYNRGWLDTQATVVISLTALPDQSQERMDFPLDIVIDHGPMISDPESATGWFSYVVSLTDDQSAYLKEAVTTKSGEELFSAVGYMDLSGVVTLRDRIQAFDLKKDGLVVEYAGYAGQGKLSSNGTLVYGGSGDKLHVEAKDDSGDDIRVDLVAVSVQCESDFSKLVEGTNLFPGKFEITVPELTVITDEQQSKLKYLRMLASVVLPENTGTTDINVETGIAVGTLGEYQFSDASLALGYNRISLMLVKQYMSMVEDMVSGQPLDPDKYFTPDVIREALSHSPEIALNRLDIKLPEGRFNGSVVFGVKEVKGVDPAMLKSNPMAMINGISVDVKAQMDKALARKLAMQQAEATVEDQLAAEREAGSEGEYTDDQKQEMITAQADMTLQMLIEQGMVVEEGDRYKGVIEFKNGEMLVNGKPSQLPLGALMGF